MCHPRARSSISCLQYKTRGIAAVPQVTVGRARATKARATSVNSPDHHGLVMLRNRTGALRDARNATVPTGRMSALPPEADPRAVHWRGLSWAINGPTYSNVEATYAGCSYATH